MTQNPPAVVEDNYSQEEVSLAESQEQNELQAAQNAHLRQRVVLLRVQRNRLQAELDAAQAELRELRPEMTSEDEEEVAS